MTMSDWLSTTASPALVPGSDSILALAREPGPAGRPTGPTAHAALPHSAGTGDAQPRLSSSVPGRPWWPRRREVSVGLFSRRSRPGTLRAASSDDLRHLEAFATS